MVSLSNMNLIKTKAIFLKILPHREFDSIVYFYTEKLGKVEIKIKGAKKIQSKLIGFCQPFVQSTLFIAKGKNIYHLIGGEIDEKFEKLSCNYLKLFLVSYVLELVDKFTKLNKPEKKIFSLILKTLESIEEYKPGQAFIVLYAFIVKFISFLGYAPELIHCVNCSKKIKERTVFFNIKSGGVVCLDCRQNKKIEGSRLEFKTYELILLLLYKNFDFWMNKKKISLKNLKEATEFIDKLAQWYIDEELSSGKVLRQFIKIYA